MRLDTAFRLSSYLSLGMACVCLAYAGASFLPEAAYLPLPAGALLLIAYLARGRWKMSDRATNLIATPIIAAGIGIWAAFRLANPPRGTLDTFFLILMGSFLTALMLALLFRVQRHRDFWLPQVTAFIAVAISCALDSDALFAVVLLVYLTCVIWSLALFQLTEEPRPLQPLESGDTLPNGRGSVPWRVAGLWQSGRRCMLAAVAAFVLFLLTPRLGITRWEGLLLDLPQVRTAAVDPGMNLFRTGTVRLSKTVAFEVSAADDQGNPKLDLPIDQRWRGSALNTYARGRCFNRVHGASIPDQRPANDPEQRMPHLGPEQYSLTFMFAHRLLHRVYLAEPVQFIPPDGPLPLVFLAGNQSPIAFAHHLNTEVPLPILGRNEKCSYRQAHASVSEPELMPAVDARQLLQGPLGQPPDVPGLREWTNRLLLRLVHEGKLAPADIERDDEGDLLPERHEKVARVLEAHLGNSGEYIYTLNLDRQDVGIDPVLDFLCNVKAGHCQRFAAGLMVMLRSQGVPARIVMGYRGADHIGDGIYQVRQCDAHSWAEVLVQRPAAPGRSEWYWLTLDPTPGSETDGGAGTGWQGWCRALWKGGGQMWQSFVVDYNAEQQEATLAQLARYLRDPSRLFSRGPLSRLRAAHLWGPLGFLIAAVIGGIWFIRRRRRGSAERPPSQLFLACETAFYGRLLAILARRCRYCPAMSQTPHEFAETVRQHLCPMVGDSLAEVPIQLTRLYYRVRYAGRPLSQAETEEVESRVLELDAGLARSANRA